MNIEKFFRLEIDKLLNYIGCDISFHINVYTGYNRCMARLWDDVNWDINKRCPKEVENSGLCRLHLKSHKTGLVNEYPDEKKVLYYYRKNKPNIDKLINIKHSSYYISPINNSNNSLNNKIEINLKQEKKTQYNLKMSLDTITNLDDMILYEAKLDKQNIYNNIISRLKSEHQCFLTIAEDNQLKKTIQNIINTFSMTNINTQINKQVPTSPLKKSDSYIDFQLDLSNSDVIRIIDNDNGCAEDLYIINNNSEYQLLYNNDKRKIGVLRDWIDEEDEVPCEYKTNDLKVLNPNNGVPVMEVEITSAYTTLSRGIYREFEYNEHLETFSNTNQLIL